MTGVDHPLAALTSRGLRRLARRAEQARARDRERFRRLARRAGVSERQLRLLADAWTAGGGPALEALGPAPPEVDAAALRRADGALEAWRRRHYPLETLTWEVWRNRVTVWRVLPAADARQAPRHVPLLQLRLTVDGGWHLYRKAAQGEWWPVRVTGARRGRADLNACLQEAHRDLGGVFWSGGPH